tara:strand:+ start:414 stop:593 length:180 start_codon:yes stop_codon:yes gene_type:complete
MIPFLKLLNEVSQGFEITPSEAFRKRHEDAPKVKDYNWFLKNVDPSGSLTDYNDWLRDQ